jgi:adenylate kinase
MNLLLIGPPGAGKTVVANKISEYYSIPFIKTGSLLRDIAQENPNYEIITSAMKKGELAPNSIVAGVVREEVSKNPDGFVLDGWMRQLSDKDQFNPNLDKVIFLNCPKNICEDRILNRVICRIHGSVYSYSDQVCQLCGGSLEKRNDDTAQTFESRWSIFEELTMPVIEYYKNLNLILEVDASKSIPDIMGDIVKGLSDNN